jgi:hypothetical protein
MTERSLAWVWPMIASETRGIQNADFRVVDFQAMRHKMVVANISDG